MASIRYSILFMRDDGETKRFRVRRFTVLLCTSLLIALPICLALSLWLNSYYFNVRKDLQTECASMEKQLEDCRYLLGRLSSLEKFLRKKDPGLTAQIQPLSDEELKLLQSSMEKIQQKEASKPLPDRLFSPASIFDRSKSEKGGQTKIETPADGNTAALPEHQASDTASGGSASANASTANSATINSGTMNSSGAGSGDPATSANAANTANIANTGSSAPSGSSAVQGSADPSGNPSGSALSGTNSSGVAAPASETTAKGGNAEQAADKNSGSFSTSGASSGAAGGVSGGVSSGTASGGELEASQTGAAGANSGSASGAAATLTSGSASGSASEVAAGSNTVVGAGTAASAKALPIADSGKLNPEQVFYDRAVFRIETLRTVLAGPRDLRFSFRLYNLTEQPRIDGHVAYTLILADGSRTPLKVKGDTEFVVNRMNRVDNAVFLRMEGVDMAGSSILIEISQGEELIYRILSPVEIKY